MASQYPSTIVCTTQGRNAKLLGQVFEFGAAKISSIAKSISRTLPSIIKKRSWFSPAFPALVGLVNLMVGGRKSHPRIHFCFYEVDTLSPSPC